MERKKLAGYEIQEILGEGGMGVVYRARDTTLDRTVAIKVIRPDGLDSKGRERFLREARACSRINHPNIVTVYSAGEDAGHPYIAMELLEGQTLREIIENGPVPWKKALSWTIDILDALDKLHGAGIVHRDLKPENIMVTPSGAVKLMDFGIARLASSKTITVEGQTMGTIYYMSPEQIIGKQTDARSDIFSIGAVLYQMLTGSFPFEGEHPAAVMYSITNEPPSPIADFSDEFPGGLSAILDRALEKDPERRFSDAGSLRDELSDLIKAEEVSAAHGLAPGPRRAFITRIVIPAALLLALAAVTFLLVLTKGGKEGDRELAIHHNELAQQHEQTGKSQEAQVEYRNAIIADPQWEVPWNNLAMLAMGMGNLAEAESLLLRAISIKPDYTAALYNLGSIRWDRKDLVGAERFFRSSIESDSSLAAGYNNLGALLIELGRIEEAGKILDEGLLKDQKRPSAPETRGFLLKNRGLVAMHMGKDEQALSYWMLALETIPENFELHRLLAEWYERNGREEEAKVHWLKVSKSDIAEDRNEALKHLQVR